MGSLRQKRVTHDLVIDHASSAPPAEPTFDKRLTLGEITLAHGILAPNDGFHLGSSQVMVALQDGAPFPMEWRLPESDRLHAGSISKGQIHLGDGRPLWCRCEAQSSFFAFAMDISFFRESEASAFDGESESTIRMTVGVEDREIERLCTLARRVLDGGDIGRRLYIEGLAAALAVHLRIGYGAPSRPPRPYRGGLTLSQQRRVLDYIATHLDDDLGLSDLAAITGLSLHHFGRAFKTTMGSSPHRYLMEQRVARACELLRRNEKTISEIACATGFSSHSHLTANFHRLTGVTPSQYRHSPP